MSYEKEGHGIRPNFRILFIGIILIFLAASWLYPPWVHYKTNSQAPSAVHPHGWFFVFDTLQDEQINSELVMRVDFGRLILVDLILISILSTTALIVTRLSAKSLVFTASVVGVGSIFCFMGIAWLQTQANVTKSKIESQSKEMSEAFARAEKIAKEKETSKQVAESDLDKIDLLDCLVPKYKGEYLQGRIRNRLDRQISSVGLKLTLLGPDQTVVEVSYATIDGFFSPQEPSSFSQPISLSKYFSFSENKVKVDIITARFW